MAHDHSHGDRNAYYLNQLFTIAVCGLLGGVAVMLWFRTLRPEGMLSLLRHPSGAELLEHPDWLRPEGMLSKMLHPKFFLWVLLGGLTLLTLVVIRAMAVWRSVDEAAHDHDHCGHDHGACHHEHEHEQGIHSREQTTNFGSVPTSLPLAGPPHAHDRDHHDHEHSHDHEHGWAPWRYVVLLLPVVLYFLGLPNQSFSVDAGGNALNDLALSTPAPVSSTGTVNVGFVDLQQASLSPESRDFYEGKTVVLTGQYDGRDPKRFTLMRLKINCCGADAVRLNCIIMVDPDSPATVDPDRYRNKWVEIKGRIHFFPKTGGNEFITALILYPTKEEPIEQCVKIIRQPSTPYLY